MHQTQFVLTEPAKGRLLISEPFLPDPNFRRTVVLLTEHNEDGSVGLVLNQPMNLNICDITDELPYELPVFTGGPVGKEGMLFLHNIEHLPGAEEVIKGVYWGGDFDLLKEWLQTETENIQIRILIGYSGWAPGQLNDELTVKSWLVTAATASDVFSTDPDDLWKAVIGRLGSEYRHYGNAPEDINLN
jgi:putative transcriptional regulator